MIQTMFCLMKVSVAIASKDLPDCGRTWGQTILISITEESLL